MNVKLLGYGRYLYRGRSRRIFKQEVGQTQSDGVGPSRVMR